MSSVISLIIPIYKNRENLNRLLTELQKLDVRFAGELEVVFVVDGSPDGCFEILRERLSALDLRSQLISLSRNFGSFPAILAGLAHGNGEYFAVLAADLQEPPELIFQFWEALRAGEADIVFGNRNSRTDPPLSQFFSEVFWALYRRFVVKDIPRGGIDVFGCSKQVRDHLLRLKEADTNLIALLFWLGFRRKFIAYERRPRLEGRTAWTFSKKLKYALDSIFNFTDLPLRLLLISGIAGTTLAGAASLVVLIGRLFGIIRAPGYTPIVLAICFFGGLTALGLGLIGQYLWLSLQNIRNRPNFIVQSAEEYSSVKKQMSVDEPERTIQAVRG